MHPEMFLVIIPINTLVYQKATLMLKVPQGVKTMSSYPKPNLCIFIVKSCFVVAENKLNMHFKCLR